MDDHEWANIFDALDDEQYDAAFEILYAHFTNPAHLYCPDCAGASNRDAVARIALQAADAEVLRRIVVRHVGGANDPPSPWEWAVCFELPNVSDRL